MHRLMFMFSITKMRKRKKQDVQSLLFFLFNILFRKHALETNSSMFARHVCKSLAAMVRKVVNSQSLPIDKRITIERVANFDFRVGRFNNLKAFVAKVAKAALPVWQPRNNYFLADEQIVRHAGAIKEHVACLFRHHYLLIGFTPPYLLNA